MSHLNLVKINSSYSQNPSQGNIYLMAKVNFIQEQIIFSRQGQDFAIQVNPKANHKLKKLFSLMNGTKTLREIQQYFSSQEQEFVNNLISVLDKNGFIDEKEILQIDSALGILSELELLRKTSINPLNLSHPKSSVNIIYGFMIESYHLASQFSAIYSPLLHLQASTKIRQVIQEYYHHIYGQEQLLLNVLQCLNINQEDLISSIPLAETVALSNALTYWANYEPIFLMSSLDEVNYQLFKHYNFGLEKSNQLSLDVSFINAIEKLLISQPSINLSHRIFQEIELIELTMKKRLKSENYLLTELFNNFYQAIDKHYSLTTELLEKVTDI